ncbi:MAG: aldehyde ferredoxin oxidoreductase C-terminal domain-containing protein, partial [Rhodospirillales bacterium]|nr:aldehyde ferredoxin oxidoreductase C-terminal domain-containing protein [Rhodospirillales bacterium]
LAVISLVVALTALGTNTWRNELTEYNRNIRHAGFSRRDDIFPERLFEEPTTGAKAGETLGRTEFEQMLDEFYDLHEWDRETGLPLPRCITRLGLDDIAPETPECSS